MAVYRSTPPGPPGDLDPPNRPCQLHQRGSNDTTYWPTEKKQNRLRGGDKEDHVDGWDEEDEEDDEAEEEQVKQKKRVKWRFWAEKRRAGAEKKWSEKEKDEKEKAEEAGEKEKAEDAGGKEEEQTNRKRRLRSRLRGMKKKDEVEKKGTEKEKHDDDEREEANTKKCCIMGRFGGLFKKSEKGKPEENPYAQQSQPTNGQNQSSPSIQSSEYPGPSQASHYRQEPSHSQYAQYNTAQFNDNQSISSVSQSSGLPSGPRPNGGYQNRVGTFSTVSADKSPPPQYSPHSSSQYSPYPGKDLPSTAATTPQTSADPSLAVGGGGFPKEKFGATGGVGRARFEPAETTFENGSRLASQQQSQGGYGSLGGSAGLGLSEGYGGSTKQPQYAGPGQDQLQDPQAEYGESSQAMTEEEDIQWKKQQIAQENAGAVQAGARALMGVQRFVQQTYEVTEQGFRQGEMMHQAHKNSKAAGVELAKTGGNLTDLHNAQSMLKFASNGKGAIESRQRQHMGYDRDHMIKTEEMDRKFAKSREQLTNLGKEYGSGPQLLGTAGAGGKGDVYAFEDMEFEDDDGTQREASRTIQGQKNEILTGLRGARAHLEVLGGELKRQNVEIAEMQEDPTDLDTSPASTPTELNHIKGDLHSAAPLPSRPPSGDPSYFAARETLPLWSRQDEIRRILQLNEVLLLVGETGSGKSTQVPQFLYQEKWCQKRKVKVKDGEHTKEINVGGMIAITQPRRVAATTLAHRVSREAGTPLDAQIQRWHNNQPVSKGLVGYSVRFDHKVPPGTRIKYLTEGMLLQELLRDPGLRQYSAIIVDEIHERSVDVDLLSGFLKQIVSGDKASRGGIPLRVVVMSATANVDKIKQFFSKAEPETTSTASTTPTFSNSSVQYLQIDGRQFPVDLVHTPKPVPDIQEALLKQIFKLHTEEALSDKHGRKDILAFLTGQEEIESAQKLIEEYASTLGPKLPGLKVFPLFGQLSMEAQHQAFQPIKGGRTRKIVLATNIAETSVTVPGVRYVIDCGKSKVKQFRPRLGMESLLAKPISKSSAIQRAGRAGREGPGKCFRLYTEETYDTLYETDLPEILRTDILGATLTMKARGIADVLSFPLMDAPSVESVEKALLHLHILGAIGDDGSITETGRKMVSFPVTPPFARVILAAADPKFDCLLEVIDIIACITSGEDIFLQLRTEEAKEEAEDYRKELYRREGDLLTYLTTMQLYAAENADRVKWCKDRKMNVRNMKQAMNIRKQLRGLCVRLGMIEPPPADPQPFTPVSPELAVAILKCFLSGFSLKTAILAPDNSYVTAHGKHVVAIHPSSVLHGQKKEAIMFLEHVIIQAVWIAEALE
ncbi:P-loop containing nucleoside triphosphate hydrolase protein [Dichotomopilus funicola]|uniref:RNA helicase n=1 Tax=Dichotomopilus funicola TaxID=1934379 RepID=A0AAN6V6N4_9PEZI|nr:P-loop containing nucleoside triphosphate hydrolase protein [Dichotomopilus funicola]